MLVDVSNSTVVGLIVIGLLAVFLFAGVLGIVERVRGRFGPPKPACHPKAPMTEEEAHRSAAGVEAYWHTKSEGYRCDLCDAWHIRPVKTEAEGLHGIW